MQRKDRQIHDPMEMISILQRCQVMRLAMLHHEKPYIVPLNYGFSYENNRFRFYFHSSSQGAKMDCLRENGRDIGFEVDHYIETVTNDISCKWSAHFESLIGLGDITWIDDSAEKIDALNLIMAHYGFEGTPSYQDKMLEKTTVFCLTATEITGKHSL